MKTTFRILVLAFALAPWVAIAQGTYPNRPVRIVVSTVRMSAPMTVWV